MTLRIFSLLIFSTLVSDGIKAYTALPPTTTPPGTTRVPTTTTTLGTTLPPTTTTTIGTTTHTTTTSPGTTQVPTTTTTPGIPLPPTTTTIGTTTHTTTTSPRTTQVPMTTATIGTTLPPLTTTPEATTKYAGSTSPPVCVDPSPDPNCADSDVELSDWPPDVLVLSDEITTEITEISFLMVSTLSMVGQNNATAVTEKVVELGVKVYDVVVAIITGIGNAIRRICRPWECRAGGKKMIRFRINGCDVIEPKPLVVVHCSGKKCKTKGGRWGLCLDDKVKFVKVRLRCSNCIRVIPRYKVTTSCICR